MATGGAAGIVLSVLGAVQTGTSEYLGHLARQRQAVRRKRGFAALERLEELEAEMQTRLLA